jgi:very-short-patch-repair endonuclease
MARRARELRKSQTAAEARVWELLRARRLAGLKFRRQYVLGSYVADFVCIPARLVIEIDGNTHSTVEEMAGDAKRTADIAGAGFRVVRLNNDYVLSDNDGDVAASILEALSTSALPLAEKKRLCDEGYISLGQSPEPLFCSGRPSP